MTWPAVMALVRAWWRALPGFVLGALIFFPLGQCSGAAKVAKREEAARAVAIAEALKTNAKASERAAEERMADAKAVARTEEELIHEVAQVADSAPTASDVALACARLRRQGTDVSDLPACR